MQQFDFSPMHQKVTAADTNSFIDEFGRKSTIIMWRIALIGATIVLLGICAYSLMRLPVSTLGVLFAGLMAAVCGFITLTIKKILYTKPTRIWKLAKINGWRYTYQSTNIPFDGIIFGTGDTKRIVNMFDIDDNDFSLQVGTMEYTVGSGDNRDVVRWSYARVPLVRRLPHMLLDANSNNIQLFGANLSNLPGGFNSNQKLSLEGNFDEHFTLFAPKEYERDALYVFTPDIMALLIDKAGAFDVEIIDDKMYLYSKKQYDTSYNIYGQNTYSSAEFLQKLINTAIIIGKRINLQTDYYADERVANRENNSIAPQGKRMKGAVAWFSIAFTIIVFIVMLLQIL